MRWVVETVGERSRPLQPPDRSIDRGSSPSTTRRPSVSAGHVSKSRGRPRYDSCRATNGRVLAATTRSPPQPSASTIRRTARSPRTNGRPTSLAPEPDRAWDRRLLRGQSRGSHRRAARTGSRRYSGFVIAGSETTSIPIWSSSSRVSASWRNVRSSSVRSMRVTSVDHPSTP
jgi:hypothetical protein